MTRDEILAMPAGCETDKEVAQGVMGWIYYDGWNHPDLDTVQGELPKYSTDIAAAWDIVKVKRHDRKFMDLLDYGEGILLAEEPALAVCHAALLSEMEA